MRKRNGTPIRKSKLLEVPADTYTQERACAVVELVGKAPREERMLSRAIAIALKTKVVDDLIGIERQAQRPVLEHHVI
jgi:hypothetical protein